MASGVNYEDGEVDDWCLVCKDGGKLLLCEFPKCERAYHCRCAGESKTIRTSSENWHCPRHSCFRCKRTPTIALCYTCPNASCSQCLDALGFVHIRDECWFCHKCLLLAMYLEKLTKKKPNMEDSSARFEHFKEYYVIIKKRYGFTLDDLVAVNERLKDREKRKHWSLDKNDENEVCQKVKLNSQTSENEVLKRDVVIRVPALTADNVQRIYLTRSVIEKLLMKPESLEEKVRRTFVGIELPQKAGSNRISRELVQVTGVTKTSLQNDQICIKLQVKNRPDDISVDMVSDMDFHENLCRNLRQQVKDGWIEMPDVEEFERMARVLSDVLVDDFIFRKTRKLQQRMDYANEKGQRQEFFLLAHKKKEMQTSKKRLQLICDFQGVDMEELFADNTSGNIVNITPQSECFSALRPIAEDIREDKKQKGNPSKLIPGSLELKREKSSGCGSKQRSMKCIDMKRRHGQVVDDNKQGVDAAGDQVLEIVPINVADHSNVQSFGVDECDGLVLARKVLEEQKRVDVMVEEFENNGQVVKGTAKD